MAEQTEKTDVVERRATPNEICALVAVLKFETGFGARLREIKETGGQGEETQQLLLELELKGLITSAVRQTGTAGTTNRFYRPVEGVCVKVFGPPQQKS